MAMMEEMYLYLTSDCNADVFPENTASSFRVKLPKTLDLKEKNCSWSIALIDVDMPKLSGDYKPNFITFESSVCAPSIYKLGLRPVLHLLYYPQIRRGFPIIIENPRYIQLNTKSIDVIDIYLTDDKDEKVSFSTGHLTCTLHLLCTDNK